MAKSCTKLLRDSSRRQSRCPRLAWTLSRGPSHYSKSHLVRQAEVNLQRVQVQQVHAQDFLGPVRQQDLHFVDGRLQFSLRNNFRNLRLTAHERSLNRQLGVALGARHRRDRKRQAPCPATRCQRGESWARHSCRYVTRSVGQDTNPLAHSFSEPEPKPPWAVRRVGRIVRALFIA